MKLIVCFLIMLVSVKDCNNKTETSNAVAPEQSEMRMTQKDMKVSYRASTRGFFQVIEIVGDSISYTNDYNLKDFKTFAIPSEEKQALQTLLSEIDIKELPNLKPPSKTHQYDAAPAAFLKVNTGDEEFMTPTFDHGKPPKMISDIVEKILSIKTMFDKP
ncbi:hypothetical protein [Winogradskyella tangerina]|uniref:hypothetical protein n=1 Tax=Winogradskyella tangerina TaxID=2023240 RepID=UPI000DBE4E80|nr:hypothetical protein [Winogradskyella tangerina]